MSAGRAHAALAIAGFLGGCGEVSDGDDARAPLPLPAEARGHQVTPDGIFTNAAIDVNGTLVVVGSRRTAASEMRDGAIVHAAPQGATARFVGGPSNDQLYAAASNGAEILAVGITRSFRGTASQDQLMLVRTEVTGTTFTVGRHFIAADEALQPRTVAPRGPGWVIGGHHLGGARGFVVVTAADGTPQHAVTFLVGGVATEVRVRRVAIDGARIYAVGHAVQNAMTSGFVAAFDGASLSSSWVRQISASADVEINDADLADTTLRVVGRAGTEGLVVDFEAATGTVTETSAWPGVQLHGLRRADSAWWVSGRTGDSAFAGVADGRALRGVKFANLALTDLSSQSLVHRGDGVSLLGSRTSGTIEIPLNATPVGACGQAALGAPFEFEGTASTVAIDASAIDVRPVTFEFDRPATAMVTTATVSPVSACN